MLAGNFGRYHNNLTHSLVVGLGAALVFGLWLKWKGYDKLFVWFLAILISYETHVLMDSATISRGVMAFWPFTSARFLAPITLFYGLHWSEGWISHRHLWTLLSELAFAAILGMGIYALFGKKDKRDRA